VIGMDIKITHRQKNQALHREEIVFEIKESKTTPARKEVREKIAALESTKPEAVAIEKISTQFGTTNAKGKAFVYADEKTLAKTELRYLVDKNLGIKREKKEKTKSPKAEKKK
jgi:ribosomal protein S24E